MKTGCGCKLNPTFSNRQYRFLHPSSIDLFMVIIASKYLLMDLIKKRRFTTNI